MTPNLDKLSEAEALAYMKAHPLQKPTVTVDLCIFSVVDADLKVLLIERGGHPFQGSWALPGGRVDVETGEDLQTAAERELEEEAGVANLYIEQLYTFGGPDRDPRDYTVSVAWLALVPERKVTAGDDARQAEWVSVQELPVLAFDHTVILSLALQRLRGKIDYSPIAFKLLSDTFTVADLMGVHQAIKGNTYDPANFRRRFRRMVEDGVLEEAPGKRITGKRSAKVYRFKRA